MPKSKPDKSALITALKAHVLQHGLNTASLRPLAAAAGTSDRMLIYHFGSKDGLIAALLEHLAADMAAGLDLAMPAARFESEHELLSTVIQMMRNDAFRPYSGVWMDIISAAAQGQRAHQEAGKAIIDAYVNWIAARHPDGEAGATTALTFIEGAIVMDFVGHSALVDSALARLAKK